MKNFKKLLCAILCLSSVFSIYGCDKSKGKKNDDAAAKKAVEKTVDDFFDNIKEMNYEDANELLLEPYDTDDLYFSNVNDRSNVDIPYPSGLQPNNYSAYDNFVYDMEDLELEKRVDLFSYEIENIEKSDDTYVCIGTFEEMDQDSADDINNEACKYADDSSIDQYINSILEAFEDGLDDVDTKEKEFELVLVKEDDEWLIDFEESDIDLEVPFTK